MLIQIVNAVVSAGTVIAALIAMRRPASMSGSPQPDMGEVFYSRMYAARAIPLGIAAGLLPFTGSGVPVRIILLAAATAQVGDAAIGLQRGERAMVASAFMAALVHIATACLL